jgi:hypothetical protein
MDLANGNRKIDVNIDVRARLEQAFGAFDQIASAGQ